MCVPQTTLVSGRLLKQMMDLVILSQIRTSFIPYHHVLATLRLLVRLPVLQVN
jgi:hypothetical protein